MCTSTHRFSDMGSNSQKHIDTFSNMYMYICMHVYIHVHTCIHIYIYIYTHTHKNIHAIYLYLIICTHMRATHKYLGLTENMLLAMS